MVQELHRRTLIRGRAVPGRRAVSAGLAGSARPATLGLIALLLGAGCRGEPPRAPGDPVLVALVDSLIPAVEQAAGIPFKHHPRAAIITRTQARAYLQQQLQRQLGGGRGRQLTDLYRLLGLLPDSVDLQKLYLDVLTEQVAGYYDPDSSAFFGVAGASPQVLRLTVEHELVHALQHDYVPLDSLMNARDNADRLLAAQSVLEGQATLVMLRMQPGVGDKVLDPDFWATARAGAMEQQQGMPELRSAPRLLQEAVIFPYFQGAEFMQWWILHHPAGVQPYGDSLPASSEQILAPERVAEGDRPIAVTIEGPSPEYSDVLGAAEMRILLAAARGQSMLVDPAILGWGGDRFALYDAGGTPALIWYVVFDTPAGRSAMLNALNGRWPPARTGYRTTAEALSISGRPGLRLVVAPDDWTRWSSLPSATASLTR